MGQPKCTEEEFISLYRNLQSTKAVANALGYSSIAMVNRRRKYIEHKNGIVLPQNNPKAAYKRTDYQCAIDESSAVARLQVEDGTVLIGSDAHIWPGPLSTMQRAFLKFTEMYAKKGELVAVIANGDFFDGARTSRHASIGWEGKPSVKAELDAVKEYMTALCIAAGKAKRFWPLGNHDMRFESRIAAMLPELEGVQGVHLKDHMPEWVPCWRVDINDDIVVRHREMGGEHADFRNVQMAGKTIVTGHDHRTNVTHWVNYTGVHWGCRSGFLGDSPEDPQFVNYLEARNPNWYPAFVKLTFVKGRLLWPELVTKHDDGSVCFRGEVIEV